MAGDLTRAEEIYRGALLADPDDVEALHLLGLVAYQRGDNASAIDLITRALAAEPACAKYHNNLGLALKAIGRTEDAMVSFSKAATLEPPDLNANLNLGVAFIEQGRWQSAEECLHKATADNPELAEAHFFLAKARKELRRFDDALASYRRAIAVKPEFAAAYVNMGNVLKRVGDLDGTIDSYRRAISIDPDVPSGYGKLLLALGYSSEIDQAEIERESRAWGGRMRAAFPVALKFANDRVPDRRLRVGYVSPDMREHSVSYFFEPLLEGHRSVEVESHCYADVARPDATTARSAAHADHWRETAGMSDEALTAAIRADGIDILVDLAGHTQGNRLEVFARKPAPVQISWLGYPNLIGLDAIDYRFVDVITDPTDSAGETLVRLPNGFLCYRPPEDAPDCVPTARHGPPTFASFNNAAKMSRACIALWARVLHAVPHSWLLLKAGGFDEPLARDRLCRAFAGHGVDAARLSLYAKTASTLEHLAFYSEADVCLDPFPYNGTTTTCEALWMGVPVVTLLGGHHRGRVGASILSRAGLEDCIAGDEDAYVEIAAGLIRDVHRRTDLRTAMRSKMADLCDAAAFAHDVEAAMREVWTRWCAAAD